MDSMDIEEMVSEVAVMNHAVGRIRPTEGDVYGI